jgi:hypothetical protein
MMHTNLVHHYERLFAFKQYHGWSLTEIEDLIPWELDAMTSLLNNYLETVELQKKQAAVNR